jgi:immunity protein, SdpI family
MLILTAAMTFFVYPLMPDRVASHWNAAGDLDGTMPKFWGLMLVPLIMYGFCALLAVLPRIDPLRLNYQKFQAAYEGFILVFVAFLFCIQVQIIVWGLGVPVSPNLTMPVMIGALFIALGFLIEHAEPNWFFGIRTPWTLSSVSVWKKTHRMGARLFKLTGLVSIIGILAGRYAYLFILVPMIAVAISTVVYSYTEFKKEQTAGTSR